MLSDDVAGGVSCSLMSVPAPGSAGRDWAGGAQRSRAADSAHQLQEGFCLPHSARPPSAPAGKGQRRGGTPSPPRIHWGNLPNFLHPWHRDSLPWPPPTPPATSPRRRLETAQVSRGCAGRRRTSPARRPRWGRGGGAKSFAEESPPEHPSCAALQR